MTNELKRELLEAGYPRKGFTLDDLITACGNEFYALRKSATAWHATAGNDTRGIIESTRDIDKTAAVAKLWLKLNT